MKRVCERERMKGETEVELCGKKKSDVVSFEEGKKVSLSSSF
jgi:hypothetical protein